MRRVLVIFLILLFPLNVFALSMSAASPWPQEEAKVQVAFADSNQVDGADVDLDIDPDEPPSAGDFHYIVGHGAALQFTCLPSRAAPLHDAPPYCHAIPPPIKPPRAA
jgi:hypothetical protein